MSNNCLNNQEKISLENFLDELINEYGQIASNELKELFEIFENATIRSLICSYDSILQYYSTMKCHLSDDDSSLKIDQVNFMFSRFFFFFLFFHWKILEFNQR